MKSLVWSLVNTFLNEGFSAIFSIILGNLLLPSELGTFVSIMMVLSYSMSLFCLKLGQGALQKLNDARVQHLKSHYFTAGWLGVLSIALTLALSMYLAKDLLVALFKLEDQRLLLMLTIPLLILKTNREYFSRILQADLRLEWLTIINLCGTAIQIISSFLFIWAGYGLYGIIAGVYLGDLIAVIGSSYLSFRTYGLTLEGSVLGSAKDLLKFSALIHLGTIAVFLDKNVDVFFVNYFLAKEQLAVYNYASKLALLMLLFGNSISVVTFPKLTRSFSSFNKEEASRIYSISLNFSFLVLSVFSLILVFHLEYLIDLILPSIYLSVIPPFSILLLAIVLFGSFAAVGTIFTARGIPGYSALSTWVALGINFVLCLTLI
ncbi:MAG: lipopolysaccharide biosynthesis protein, partial [Candidatus Hodarchaeota archaeon]